MASNISIIGIAVYLPVSTLSILSCFSSPVLLLFSTQALTIFSAMQKALCGQSAQPVHILSHLSASGVSKALSMASKSPSSPVSPLADIPAAGTPISLSSSAISTLMPLFSASSIRLTHITVLPPRLITCMARFSPLSRQVASHITIAASAFFASIKSRAISSSLEWAKSEYVPGRSTIL